jgi:hypothetical protein
MFNTYLIDSKDKVEIKNDWLKIKNKLISLKLIDYITVEDFFVCEEWHICIFYKEGFKEFIFKDIKKRDEVFNKIEKQLLNKED